MHPTPPPAAPVLARLQAGGGGTARVRLRLRLRGAAVHLLVGRLSLRGISARTHAKFSCRADDCETCRGQDAPLSA